MIPTLRVRLTAIYGGVFVVFIAILLGVSYWLMARHLDRTLDPFAAGAALAQLGTQYLLALAGATLVATALGWALAGRELASMQEAFDARERFVANASHELRSPLTVIRTEADVTLANPDAAVDELRAMGAPGDRRRRRDGRAARRPDGARALRPRAARGRVRRPRRGRRRRRPPRAAGGVRVRLDLEPVGVTGERRLLERLAGQPDRERRPLQRAGRLRRRQHPRRPTAAPCLTSSTAGRSSTRTVARG